MKATKAYIASLGTTGVLLGASLMTLAVVSAVVAFDGWPNGQVPTRVQTLRLAGHAPVIRVSATAGSHGAAPARAAARTLAGGAPAHVTIPGATVPDVQRVAGERVAGGHPAAPSSPLPVKPPVDPPQIPTIPFDPSNPQGLAGQVADGTQTGTSTLGSTVGGDAGAAVSAAGQTTADTLRMLPLPGPLFP